jgi:tRNA(adenine34) deaminase
MEDYYIMMALKEAEKAYRKNNVPVGAIIVRNNRIIARAHNRKEKTNVATHHAEILVIEKACRKLKSWRLNDCEMYVSLEPCLMCVGAILESRIKKVTYCVKRKKNVFIDVEKIKNTKFVYKRINNDAEKMLKSFFKNKR